MSSAQDESAEYHLEYIEKAYQDNRDEWHYIVKWYGYSTSENTDEVATSVSQCPSSVSKFWEFAEQKQGIYQVASKHQGAYNQYIEQVKRTLAGDGSDSGDGVAPGEELYDDEGYVFIPLHCLWLAPEKLGYDRSDRDECYEIVSQALNNPAKVTEVFKRAKVYRRADREWNELQCGVCQDANEGMDIILACSCHQVRQTVCDLCWRDDRLADLSVSNLSPCHSCQEPPINIKWLLGTDQARRKTKMTSNKRRANAR